MAADLNELVLTVFGGPLAQVAGGVVALYALLVVIESIRRVFSNRG